MKLTKRVIKQFEREQQQYGTDVALSNFVWNIAANLLASVGVTGIKTTYGKSRMK